MLKAGVACGMRVQNLRIALSGMGLASMGLVTAREFCAGTPQANITKLMKVNSIRANSTDLQYSRGRVVVDLKGSGATKSRTVKGPLEQKMAKSILDSGGMDASTKEVGALLKMPRRRNVVSISK